MPATQLIQTEAPAAEYVPAGHNEQFAADADVAPDCPYFPVEQSVPEQVDEKLAPTTFEYVPAVQFVHTDWEDAPAVGEYFPAMQSVQLDWEEEPSVGEYFPAMQSVHTEAPAVVEYFPAIQSVQLDWEEAPVYFPESHGRQAALPAPFLPVPL